HGAVVVTVVVTVALERTSVHKFRRKRGGQVQQRLAAVVLVFGSSGLGRALRPSIGSGGARKRSERSQATPSPALTAATSAGHSAGRLSVDWHRPVRHFEEEAAAALRVSSAAPWVMTLSGLRQCYHSKISQVVVVGNPANTNALICSKFAPSIPAKNFSALTRLDQNRARAQIAAYLGLPCNSVSRTVIWGNHSNTQFPDASNGVVRGLDGVEKSVYDAVANEEWLKGKFLTTVQQRGAAVIKARKLSSAMSAAKAICDHARDWHFGTPAGDFVSMAVISDGNGYGVQNNLMYSFPLTISNGEWRIVEGLNLNDWAKEKLKATEAELIEERDTALSVCEA
uniref:Ldh_1_C domain-containing protein n=1 Tax=Macrostomum lignano TaxID=282301 RepID=A0A1I8F264_9PLAT